MKTREVIDLGKVESREKVNIRMIECELYNYEISKKEIQEFENDIIEGRNVYEVAVQTGHGNSTQSKALQLISSYSIREMERRVDAIEYAINVLESCPEPRKLELLKMKYFERKYIDRGIWQELNIEQATFYRWRKEIIRLIADRLGYKVA